MSCKTCASGVDEAQWEPPVKSFFAEYARLSKREEALFQASYLAWQWMHGTAFYPVETNAFVTSEPLLAWAAEHNKKAGKAAAARDALSSKKPSAGDLKDVTDYVRRDAQELKSAISKALGPAESDNYNQACLAKRAKELSENEKTLVKGIDHMADYINSLKKR